MDAQELRNLQEAYMEVVENQQLNELSDIKVQKTLKARERRFSRSIDSGAPNREFHQLRRTEKLVASRNRRTGSNIPVDEEYADLYDIILSHLLDEGYADTNKAALAIMANMSEEWKQSIVEELISEGEKPFPHEKVERKQKALRSQGGDALERRMKMGLARRRATEAEKTGGSQRDAGAGWYHGR